MLLLLLVHIFSFPLLLFARCSVLFYNFKQSRGRVLAQARQHPQQRQQQQLKLGKKNVVQKLLASFLKNNKNCYPACKTKKKEKKHYIAYTL